MGLLRSNVGENGDHALCAECQHRNDLVIISGIYIHMSAGQLEDLRNCGEVSARFLDSDDILDILAEINDGLRCDIHACTARYVVEDRRDFDGVGDLCEVGLSTVLGRFIIVRGN